MPATARPASPGVGAKTTLKTANGKLVSKRSKTGDPACSAAMSDWVKNRKSGHVDHAVFSILAKCRAKSRTMNQAAAHKRAGNDLKGQALDHRVAAGKPLTQKDRTAKARELIASRKAAMAHTNSGRDVSHMFAHRGPDRFGNKSVAAEHFPVGSAVSIRSGKRESAMKVSGHKQGRDGSVAHSVAARPAGKATTAPAKVVPAADPLNVAAGKLHGLSARARVGTLDHATSKPEIRAALAPLSGSERHGLGGVMGLGRPADRVSLDRMVDVVHAKLGKIDRDAAKRLAKTPPRPKWIEGRVVEPAKALPASAAPAVHKAGATSEHSPTWAPHEEHALRSLNQTYHHSTDDAHTYAHLDQQVDHAFARLTNHEALRVAHGFGKTNARSKKQAVEMVKEQVSERKHHHVRTRNWHKDMPDGPAPHERPGGGYHEPIPAPTPPKVSASKPAREPRAPKTPPAPKTTTPRAAPAIDHVKTRASLDGIRGLYGKATSDSVSYGHIKSEVDRHLVKLTGAEAEHVAREFGLNSRGRKGAIRDIHEKISDFKATNLRTRF